jgi:hypothetical protein
VEMESLKRVKIATVAGQQDVVQTPAATQLPASL